MSLVSKTVSVCGEVDSLLGVVVKVVGDVKSGKSPADVLSDVGPTLLAALGGLSQVSSEVADRKDLEVTVALKLAELVNVLVP